VFMLDPMVDDLSAGKADLALNPGTITNNVLWQQLTALRQTGQHPPALLCPPNKLAEFVTKLEMCDDCLTPTADQADVIAATDQALLPVQGPPGTGKTSGATAPALLARAWACAQADAPFFGVVVAPSHEAVDGVLTEVVELLSTCRHAMGELPDLDLLRLLPSSPQHLSRRADDAVDNVEVTYCNYYADAGKATLDALGTQVVGQSQQTATDTAPQLLFATPTSLYHTLKTIAETTPAIEGTSGPAAMRSEAGLADVVCIDEASMVDIPRFLLAGSVLKPTGQTILVGDHRQLATVTQVDWADTLRKPLEETQAYRSALEYVRWLNTSPLDTPGVGPHTAPDGGSRQTRLTRSLTGAHSGDSGGVDDGA